MKNIILISLFCFSFVLHGQSKKNVLIEVFTNSHCGLCPNAHNTIDNFLATSEKAAQIKTIYYHMSFPYSDDQLNLNNPEHSSFRNEFYGPFFFTPIAWFDGERQPTSSYGEWGTTLDNLLLETSPLEIELDGDTSGDEVSLNISVNKTGEITQDQLYLYIVVVENIDYTGRNGISNHKTVMRLMPYPNGKTIDLSKSTLSTYLEMIPLNSDWIPENLSFIVFVQNNESKNVFQVQSLDYSDLAVTDVKEEDLLVTDYKLFQNYPNPFNPSTTISFFIPNDGLVELSVYNILGNEVALLVKDYKVAGTHNINFDASDLSSGVYFYKLKSKNFTSSKKMILLR